ncbi:hypothetical protein IT413_02020 [Candidatus Peregrinibacteria bacterium]|nr:hypothetical protein [Candidatus Peregrinibacteria bacterium]
MPEPNPQQQTPVPEQAPAPAPEVQQQMPGMPEMQSQVIDGQAVMNESNKAKEEAKSKIAGSQHKIDLLAAVKVDEVVIPKM